MDIIMQGKKPEVNIEYFGQQSRFYDFFKEIIEPLLGKAGIYAETNSGSNCNAYMFAKRGYKVITNDVSEYSYSLSKAIMSNDIPIETNCNIEWLKTYGDTYIKRAAVFASLVDIYGYNSIIPENLNEKLKQKIEEYINYFKAKNFNNIRTYKAYNDDLFNYFNRLKEANISVEVMFMDFAWPWRNGTETEEYNTTANVYNNVFEQKNENKTKIWNKNNVIDNVIKAVNEAKKISKYVLLSNQSSNFPTPELLEVALLKNNIQYEIRHTMLTDAEYEDNLGKENFFREYLYVIKGNLYDKN